MNRKIELLMSIALLCCSIFLARWGALLTKSIKFPPPSNTYHTSETDSSSTENYDSTDKTPLELSSFCIVIDAGHGGADPGKVGITNLLEKDINLSIALLLSEELNANGISTVLTRETDTDLANGASNLKSADMRNRCQLIIDTAPIFTISIHQNSYPSETVTGAQVFYFTHSEEGRILASTLQNSLIANLDPSNTRQPKANDTYYLLKKTPTPTVIVECGFLSSPVESALLSTLEYQKKIVSAISLGVMEYLKTNDYL